MIRYRLESCAASGYPPVRISLNRRGYWELIGWLPTADAARAHIAKYWPTAEEA